MRTLQDVGERPRECHHQLRSPLSQPQHAWLTLSEAQLRAVQDPLRLRRTDPGGILAMCEDVLGPATGWCVLADNVAGVLGWRGVSFEEQYRALIHGAGAFIATTMCYLRVGGPGAGAVLDTLSPRKVSDLAVDSARLALFTTPLGTVDDEAVVVRTAEDEFEISCGGGKHPSWLADVLPEHSGVRVEESDVHGFNIKGPERLAAVQSLLHPDDTGPVSRLRTFRSCPARTLAGHRCRVLKTLIGYEVWAAQEALAETWRTLLCERPQIVPCAWDVLTTYRMECSAMVFGLYPLDLHAGTDLRDIGFGWMVGRAGRHDYVGKAALEDTGRRQQLWLAGVEAPGGLPLPPVGREVLSPVGAFVGHVTSVAMSPGHGRPLGFAHLLPNCPPGSRVLIDGAPWTVRELPHAPGSRGPAVA